MALDSGALPVAGAGTVARTDFNTAMTALDAAFPLTKENLDGDAVVTVKIKDLNVTPAKASLGFGRYVPRNLNAWDKQIGDFTTDGNFKLNGLDVSGIVPAGAVAVHLRIELSDDAANSLFIVRADAAFAEAQMRTRTQVANISLDLNGVIPISSDRLLDYYGSNLVFIAINVGVLGWFT